LHFEKKTNLFVIAKDVQMCHIDLFVLNSQISSKQIEKMQTTSNFDGEKAKKTARTKINTVDPRYKRSWHSRF